MDTLVEMKLKNIHKMIVEGVKEDLALELLKNIIADSEFSGKAFIAGGFVRDELMGTPSKDIDIVVELPQGGIKFAEYVTKKLGIYKEGSNPTIFPTFGTAKFNLRRVKYKGVDLSEIDIECVMTRKEQYHTNSRNPDVSPGTLKDDVERRDFTINSLLKSLSTGEILDLTGMGKDDIKKGIIRTPLDPDIIFSEDPLRMLRAIRFTVKYGWHLPMFMIRAIKKNAPRLKIISKERIKDELNKILVSKKPEVGIRLMVLTGLSDYVFPEMHELIGLTQTKHHKDTAFDHVMEVIKNTPPDLITRLAATFHDIGKARTKTDGVINCKKCGEEVYIKTNTSGNIICPHCGYENEYKSLDDLRKDIIKSEIHFLQHEDVSATMAKQIMRRLKYPTDITDAVCQIIGKHMSTKGFGDEADISDKTLRKLKLDMGEHLEQLLDLIHADNISHSEEHSMPNQVPKIREKLKTVKMIPPRQHLLLPINGKEIIDKFNIHPGPKVGELLKKVEDAFLDNPDLTREDAFEIVKNNL